jgi:phage gp36-like protein
MAGSYSIDLNAMKSRLSDQRLIQITDDAGSGSIDTAKVDDAITAAEAEFHLYAGVYYTTPVRKSDNTIPQGIREKLLDATAWRLMQRRPEFLRGSEDEGKMWADRRAEVLAWYEAIAASDPKKKLPIAEAVEKAAAAVADGHGLPKVGSDDSLFSRDRRVGFM